MFIGINQLLVAELAFLFPFSRHGSKGTAWLCMVTKFLFICNTNRTKCYKKAPFCYFKPVLGCFLHGKGVDWMQY